MKKIKKRRCIFLDRDGTINVYKGLISKAKDIKLEPNAAEAIRLINKSEYLCIVVTNQPVVARNLCSYQDVIKINNKLLDLLAQKCAHIDDIFFCPHHPDRGYPEENKRYKIKCKCRKPNIGMIKEAADKHDIDLSKSYIIGDTTIDIMTGKNANLKTVLVKTGLGGKDGNFDVKPDFVASDLLSAVKLVLENKQEVK